VSGIFDLVIWYTVSQKYNIEDLHTSIAKTLSLDIKENSNVDMMKMKLSASLEQKRFFLILCNFWTPIYLD